MAGESARLLCLVARLCFFAGACEGGWECAGVHDASVMCASNSTSPYATSHVHTMFCSQALRAVGRDGGGLGAYWRGVILSPLPLHCLSPCSSLSSAMVCLVLSLSHACVWARMRQGGHARVCLSVPAAPPRQASPRSWWKAAQVVRSCLRAKRVRLTFCAPPLLSMSW